LHPEVKVDIDVTVARSMEEATMKAQQVADLLERAEDAEKLIGETGGEEPAAEDDAPILLVANEVERVDERPDRSLFAGRERHLAPPRMKVGRHFSAIRFVIDDFSDCCEALQRIAAGKCRPRRVKDDAITLRHPFEAGVLPVSRLRESAGNAALNVMASVSALIALSYALNPFSVFATHSRIGTSLTCPVTDTSRSVVLTLTFPSRNKPGPSFSTGCGFGAL